MREQRSISALLGVATVKIQTIELIAELIKCKQNELESESKHYDIQKVKEYADDIIQLSSEISGLLDSCEGEFETQEEA